MFDQKFTSRVLLGLSIFSNGAMPIMASYEYEDDDYDDYEEVFYDYEAGTKEEKDEENKDPKWIVSVSTSLQNIEGADFNNHNFCDREEAMNEKYGKAKVEYNNKAFWGTEQEFTFEACFDGVKNDATCARSISGKLKGDIRKNLSHETKLTGKFSGVGNKEKEGGEVEATVRYDLGMCNAGGIFKVGYTKESGSSYKSEGGAGLFVEKKDMPYVSLAKLGGGFDLFDGNGKMVGEKILDHGFGKLEIKFDEERLGGVKTKLIGTYNFNSEDSHRKWSVGLQGDKDFSISSLNKVVGADWNLFDKVTVGGKLFRKGYDRDFLYIHTCNEHGANFLNFNVKVAGDLPSKTNGAKWFVSAGATKNWSGFKIKEPATIISNGKFVTRAGISVTV